MRFVSFLVLAIGLPCAVAAQRSICTAGTGGVDQACFYTADNQVLYGHNILGDTPEWTELHVTVSGSDRVKTLRLKDHIFEDIAPRIVDVDGDGQAEVVVIESSFTQGGRIAVYQIGDTITLQTATPYIGRRNRWMAPIAVTDLDGDGRVELAYIDRPHLAKILRLWRFQNGKLRHLADMAGLTNHRIGQPDIAGGLRDCGMAVEMIVASADWRNIMAVTFDGKTLRARPIGPHQGRRSFAKAMSCT